MQIIKNEDLKSVFSNIDSQLAFIEVKGDSVQYLYNVRGILKALFDKIEEDKPEEKDGKPDELPDV